MNSPAHEIIGGAEGSQTFRQWFDTSVPAAADPRLSGVNYGQLVIVTNSGARTNRELMKTLIHELFHVAGFMGHEQVANILELRPRRNGMPLATASGLLDAWIDKCIGQEQ